MGDQEKRYVGNVVKRRYAVGSKSERPAVMLVTRFGEFVLRRPDATSLVDPELDGLVGKRIRVRGIVHRHMLTIVAWEEVGAPRPAGKPRRPRGG